MNLFQTFFADALNVLGRDVLKFFLNDFFARRLGIFGGVVFQILFERHEGVGLAAVADFRRLDEFHKPVAGASFSVTRRTEAGDVSQFEQPVNNLVERAAVFDVELGGVVFFGFFLDVAADGGSGTAADLGDADFQNLLADGCRFSGRNNHAGVRNGDAEYRNDFHKNVVWNGVGKVDRVDVVCRTNSRDADRVRTDAESGFQMFRVHEHADEIVAIQVQAKQNPAADVVDAALHGAIHRLGVPGVVVFRSGGMKGFVRLFVVRFLEQNVRSDSRFFQLAVVLDRGSGNVDVDASNRPVFVLDRVNRFDGFENVLNRVHGRMLACLESQTLVSHVLQRDDFRPNLVL